MSRPRRKPRTPDRIVVSYRDQLLGQGYLNAVRKQGKLIAIKVFGQVYGPGHEPPAGVERLKIHNGRGRPPAGSIGLIAAIAAATGYSERVILRALAGAPRAGRSDRLSTACPHCGHDPAAEPTHMPMPPSGTPGRGLAAVGLVEANPAQKRLVDPLRDARSALAEALDHALRIGAIGDASKASAQQLLADIESKE